MRRIRHEAWLVGAAFGLLASTALAAPSGTLTVGTDGVRTAGPDRTAPAGSIQTGPGQQTELVFADGTSVLVQPNTRLTVLADGQIQLVSGSIRVLTGQDGGSVSIATPAGPMQLTGGGALISADASGAVQGLLLVSGGALTLTTASGPQTVTRTGFAVAAQPNGAASIFRPSAEQLAAALPGGGLEASLAPAAGGDPGATASPGGLGTSLSSPQGLAVPGAGTPGGPATEITQSFASLSPTPGATGGTGGGAGGSGGGTGGSGGGAGGSGGGGGTGGAPALTIPAPRSPSGELGGGQGFTIAAATAFDPVSSDPPSINNTPAVSNDSYRLAAFEFSGGGRLTQSAGGARKADEFIYLMKRTGLDANNDPDGTLQGIYFIVSNENDNPDAAGSPAFTALQGAGRSSLIFVEEGDARDLLLGKGVTQSNVTAKSGYFIDPNNTGNHDLTGALLLANMRDPSVLFDNTAYDPNANPFGQLTGYQGTDAGNITSGLGFFAALDFRPYVEPADPGAGVKPLRFFRFAGMESDAPPAVPGGLPGADAFFVDRFALRPGLLPGATPLSETFLRRDETFGDLTAASPATTTLIVVNRGPAAESRNVALFADLSFTGEGAAQQSSISVMVGAVFPDSDATPGLIANLAGSSRQNASAGSTAIDSAVRTASVQGNVIGSRNEGANHGFGGNPATGSRNGYYVLTDAAGAPSAERPVIPTSQGAAGAVDYNFLRLASASSELASFTVGQRSGESLQGFAAALAESPEANSVSILPVAFGGDAGYGVQISRSPDANRLAATFTGAIGAAASTIGFGGLDGATDTASAFVTEQVFAASATSGSVAGSALTFSGVPGARTAAAMITGDSLSPGLPLSQRAKLCACDFMQWGFFLGDLLNAAGRRDHIHMGTWVAGRAPEVLPAQGTADYSGHAIGNVQNGGAVYTAIGNLGMSWNFATRTGTTSITNFDGASYTGNLETVENSVRFRGNLTGVGVTREGGLNGSFFGGAESALQPPAGLGGNFFVQETAGAVYRVHGTFAGQRQQPPGGGGSGGSGSVIIGP